MLLKEGLWTGTGTYFSDEKLLMPVECLFDVKIKNDKYELIGIWQNTNEDQKHGFVLKYTNTDTLCDISLIYDTHVFTGTLSQRQEPFIGTLKSKDKTIFIGISFTESRNGYTFRGYVQGSESNIQWHINLFEHHRNPAQENRGPLKGCA